MARQIGEIKITGTVDDLVFYRMGGEYYVRLKSSLTGKRFRKDKAFEGSRRSCELLKRASPLASLLYRLLPKERRGREVFLALTGRIKLLLRDGWDEERIRQWFTAEYLPVSEPDKQAVPAVPPESSVIKLVPGRQRRKALVVFSYRGYGAMTERSGRSNCFSNKLSWRKTRMNRTKKARCRGKPSRRLFPTTAMDEG